MFTIKHIGIHGDHSIFSAAAAVRGDPTDDGSHGRLEFYDQDHGLVHHPIVYGKVFVMNDSGRTVADYDLGGWEFAKKAA